MPPRSSLRRRAELVESDLPGVPGTGLVGFVRLDLLALSLSIAAFTAPFALVIPYWSRYRIPIEPIIVVAATLTLSQVARFLSSRSTPPAHS